MAVGVFMGAVAVCLCRGGRVGGGGGARVFVCSGDRVGST